MHCGEIITDYITVHIHIMLWWLWIMIHMSSFSCSEALNSCKFKIVTSLHLQCMKRPSLGCTVLQDNSKTATVLNSMTWHLYNKFSIIMLNLFAIKVTNAIRDFGNLITCRNKSPSYLSARMFNLFGIFVCVNFTFAWFNYKNKLLLLTSHPEMKQQISAFEEFHTLQ